MVFNPLFVYFSQLLLFTVIRIEYYDSGVSCRLYLLRDELENLISRETEGRARCQNFPTHREVNTTDRKHALA